MNDIAVLLFALTDMAKVEHAGVDVSPAAALLLDVIAAAPGGAAARYCLVDWAMTQLNPSDEFAVEAIELAFAVEARVAWLTSSRAA